VRHLLCKILGHRCYSDVRPEFDATWHGCHRCKRGYWNDRLGVTFRCRCRIPTMKETIRLVDNKGNLLTEAKLVSVQKDHCHARLPVGAVMPIWHGGTYTIDETPWSQNGLANIYFSLPSGWENIWGQGINEDVDTVQIHPSDLAAILRSLDRG
jgi:hypothetical protein